MLNPVVVESCPQPLEWTVPGEFWRQSPFADRFLEGVQARIRGVFHLGAVEPLPIVRQGSLREYYTYLARALSFPFRASLCEEMEPLVLDGSVIATRFCDPIETPFNSAKGILCEVDFPHAVRLPLALLKVVPWNHNCRMIDDYWHWFWNYR
jgi:hypothetical protein